MKKDTNTRITHNTIIAAFFMIFHILALSIIDVTIKLFTPDLSVVLIVFLFKAIILICIIPWCFYQGLKPMKTNRLGLHIIRGSLSLAAQISFFYALQHLLLSDVIAVKYLEYVIILIIGILYFKEKATKTKLFAIGFSFLGAIAVVQPDLFNLKTNIVFKGFNPYFGFIFLTVVLHALNSTTIKVLGRTEKTKVQLFYVTLVSLVLTFPGALMKWESCSVVGISIIYPYALLNISEFGITESHCYAIALLALCYFIHSIFQFQAFKRAEISAIIPFEYSRLIFAGILGYAFLNEIITDYRKIYGYILIMLAGLYLIYSERRRFKRAKKKLELQEEFGH